MQDITKKVDITPAKLEECMSNIDKMIELSTQKIETLKKLKFAIKLKKLKVENPEETDVYCVKHRQRIKDSKPMKFELVESWVYDRKEAYDKFERFNMCGSNKIQKYKLL